jgi:type IV pilus assembly protein PilA
VVDVTQTTTMNTKLQNPPRKKLLAKVRAGFSLIELLVVIAVIGIIAAIAIPNIAGITGSANTARDKRNAQQLASVYSAAVAAGHTPATGVSTCTNEIAAGNSITLNGMTFAVPGLSGADLTSAEGHLSADTSVGITYTPQ